MKINRKPPKGSPWSREEMILVLNLYLKLPYGQMDHRNKQVKELANIMGRTDNSIAMRLNNFAACDPILAARGIKALGALKKQCKPYWDEFADNRDALVFESEKILADYQGIAIEDKFEDDLLDIPNSFKGEDRVREVKARVNQNFFRQMVLANYCGKCALTGIDIGKLLIASHIIPWSLNEKERLNPENGICLSSLYDKAFDSGLISFKNDGSVLFSTKLESNAGKDYYTRYFIPIYNGKLTIPNKYHPNPMFLEWHRDTIFNN